MSEQERGDVATQLTDEIKELAAKCNDKHVRVVQAILSGVYSSNTAAYQSVYPDLSDEVAASAVWRMLRNVEVKALHTALKEQRLLDGIISRNQAMKILSDMADTSMGDIIEFGNREIAVDEDGEPVMMATWKFKNAEELTEKQLRSINEVNVTKDGLKIKQHDQKAAIKQLSEMMGWNEAKKVDVTGLEIIGELLYGKSGS